jgi:quinoprotein glucose dehydrogenase
MAEADLTTLFLTPEERAQWLERLRRARTGLFTPLSTEYETIAVPGAVGGANWGNTASNPAKGLVYVISQDFPSFYQLSQEPPARRWAIPGRGLEQQPGAGLYAESCQACHGPEGRGTPTAPALIGLATRTQFADFRQVVLAGRGHMPAFPAVDDAAMRTLWDFIAAETSERPADGSLPLPPEGPPPVPDGPVVGVGGAPGGLEVRRGPARIPGGAPYPEGVDVPKSRYYTDYGLSYPYIMNGRWSQITAYDLNTGEIKWQRPLGVDRIAGEVGVTNTGVPRGGQRVGMVVTSTGLLFATTRDGTVRAYDAETGDILWTGDLPRGAEGLPAMYQIAGRQYLVVCATTNLSWGKTSRASGPWTAADGEPKGPGAYVVFALPESTTTSPR